MHASPRMHRPGQGTTGRLPMSLPPNPHPLLADTLHRVVRRYRLPATPDTLATPESPQSADPATTLAITIEQTRTSMAYGIAPGPEQQHRFTQALADLIHEALRPTGGDAAFQAILLRHHAPQVQEYASLYAHVDQDRRSIHAIVNAIAHPAKLERLQADAKRDRLAQLHALKDAADWSALADTARQLVDSGVLDTRAAQGLARLLASDELDRLQRLTALGSDIEVQHYQALLDRQAPRSGTDAAIAQGSAAQLRGACVETKTAQVLNALAEALNKTTPAQPPYRIVTSMRVPASIPGNTDRAKSEWDAVLLREAAPIDGKPCWDVCLLVEVKASVDAATTDFARLLRGLQLLTSADRDTVYTFATHQGEVNLRGASLAALPTELSELAGTVLYCSDAPADTRPRLLSAASRMQLLASDTSLAYAGKVASGQTPAPRELEPVWDALLASARWRAVLDQYQGLYKVRSLMVHLDDLSAAIDDGRPAHASAEPKDAGTSKPRDERVRASPRTSGLIVNDDAALERCADELGARAAHKP